MLHNMYPVNIILHSMYHANIMLHSMYPANIMLHSMYPANTMLHMYPANIKLPSMYPANIKLHKTGIAERNNCQWCQETDDTEHAIHTGHKLSAFWETGEDFFTYT